MIEAIGKGLGWIILASPFLWIAAHTSRKIKKLPTDGFSPPNLWRVVLGLPFFILFFAVIRDPEAPGYYFVLGALLYSLLGGYVLIFCLIWYRYGWEAAIRINWWPSKSE